LPKSEAKNDKWQLGSEEFKFIHTPARLQILVTLAVVESADFLFIMNQTGLTRGNLSSHMSKLETEGLIEVKKEFIDKVPRTLLCITDKGRVSIQKYRKNMMQVLDDIPVDSSFPIVITCPNCAKELPVNANFCIQCGTPINKDD
jgi:DNA-binding MarR family transcriptional regulator